MGNKTRKDGAFKGERTRLAGRGEERKEGGKGNNERVVGKPGRIVPMLRVVFSFTVKRVLERRTWLPPCWP